MDKISFEELPSKIVEVLNNQKEIIRMLNDTPANRKAEYLTRKQVKELLKINSDVTIIEMERKGKLKPYRIGRNILYRSNEVHEAMRNFKR